MKMYEKWSQRGPRTGGRTMLLCAGMAETRFCTFSIFVDSWTPNRRPSRNMRRHGRIAHGARLGAPLRDTVSRSKTSRNQEVASDPLEDFSKRRIRLETSFKINVCSIFELWEAHGTARNPQDPPKSGLHRFCDNL